MGCITRVVNLGTTTKLSSRNFVPNQNQGYVVVVFRPKIEYYKGKCHFSFVVFFHYFEQIMVKKAICFRVNMSQRPL